MTRPSQATITRLADHRRVAQPGGNNTGTRRRFGNVRKLPSGRWQASYQGPDGARHNAGTTFLTKGAAQGWLSTQEAKVIDQSWRPPTRRGERITFAEWSERWLRQRDLAPRTRSGYADLLRRFLLPAFGPSPLGMIDSDMVEEWWAGLDRSKKTTRARCYQLLHAIMASAVKSKPPLIQVNPVDIEGASTIERSEEPRIVSVATLGALFDEISPRYRAMVWLGGYCGLRFGELTELRRKDVNLADGTVKVRRGVTRVDGEFVVGEPKAGSKGTVHLPEHLVPVLAEHLAEHAEPGPAGLLFPARQGGHLNYSSFHKVFDRARRAVGCPDFTVHGLRHTAATMAAQEGATMKELMGMLRQRSSQAAMLYQHVADDRPRALADRIAARHARGE